MTTFGRPSWLDRAVDEALAVCPTMQPWEVRVMLIAAAPTIQNAATEAARAELAALDLAIQQTLGAGLLDCEFHAVDWYDDCDQCAYWGPAARAFQAFRAERRA